jgi:hypothetical protein
MSCKKCGSDRMADVSAKCSDMCSISVGENSKHDYVPDDMGIGGGDYVDFTYCLACGQIAGKWPLPISVLEHGEDDEDDL